MDNSPSNDNFDSLMLQLGWPTDTFSYDPFVGNQEVIGQIGVLTHLARSEPDSFFPHFGNNTFRKLLRFLFDRRQCTCGELKKICSNERILAQHLAYMLTKNVVEQNEDTWRVSAAYAHIHDIGKTLEWYVAEWFHIYLRVPVRYGVKLQGMPKGGDLDVVTFVYEKQVFIECKSRRIENIDDEELHLFLQRAAHFHPAIALLLVDTDTSIETLSERIKRIYVTSELIGPENTQGIQWNTDCIQITNTHQGRKGIDNALRAIFDVSRRDRDKPLAGLSSFDIQRIKGVLPGLNKVDSLVMKLLCEKAIATHNTFIYTKDIQEEAQQINISQEELSEAIEMLMRKKYTQITRFSDMTVRNELTISGFEEYARTFRDDYASTVKAVASLIVNTTPTPTNSYALAASLGQQPRIIDHILLFLGSKELIKLQKSFSGPMHIYEISPELKRVVRDGKEL